MKLTKVSKIFDIYLSNDPRISQQRVQVYKNGKILFRFMDRLYISDKVYNLSPDYVAELNRIREKYFKEVIDNDYNRRVLDTCIKAIKTTLPTRGSLLDFGCGDGSYGIRLREAFPFVTLIGLDLRYPENQDHLKKYYDHFIKIGTRERLPFASNNFDVIISLFVFHFPVYESQVLELRRVLKVGGKLFINLINSANFKVIDMLEKHGLHVEANYNISATHNQGHGFLVTNNKDENA